MTQKTTTTSDKTYQALYLKERQKTRIFLITTVVALLAFVGTGIGYVTKSDSSLPSNVPAAGQFPGGDQEGMQGGPGQGGPMQGGPGGMLDITNFFDESGNVDQDQIDQITENVPDGFKDRILETLDDSIDTAVDDGEITSAQGSALKAALGLTS